MKKYFKIFFKPRLLIIKYHSATRRKYLTIERRQMERIQSKRVKLSNVLPTNSEFSQIKTICGILSEEISNDSEELSPIKTFFVLNMRLAT